MLLVESDETLGKIEQILSAGSIVALVNGGAAVGSSAVLRLLTERATAAGRAVVSVVGSPAGRLVPGALLEEVVDLALLTRRPVSAAGTCLPGEGCTIGRAGLDLLAEMTAESPVVIVVHNVHHADAESLDGLRHLADELHDRPLTIVAGWDRRDAADMSSALRHFICRADMQVPARTLSVGGVGQLLRGSVPVADVVSLAAEHHRLTGGNPLLINALREDAVAGEVLNGDALRQAVLSSVGQAGAHAVRLTRCVAVLGDAADAHLVTRLTRDDADAVRESHRLLNEMGVLDGYRFRYPPVAATVLQAMPPEELPALRHEAARLLHDSGAPRRPVIELLVTAGPLAQPWVVALAEEAAREAVSGKDVRRAIDYLEFAVECCTEASQRYMLKVRRAELYSLVDPAASEAQLLALTPPTLAGKLDGRDALHVARGRLSSLHFDEAAKIIGRVAGRPGAEALDAEWRLTRLVVGTSYPGMLLRLRPVPLWSPPAGRVALPSDPPVVHATQALSDVLSRDPGSRAVSAAQRVLEAAEVPDEDSGTVVAALLALVYADQLPDASRWCDHLPAFAGRRDEPGWCLLIHSFRALIALRLGRLGESVQHARDALALVGPEDSTDTAGLLLATLIEAHTAAGDLPAAADWLSRPINPALFGTRAGLHYLHARGRYQLAADRVHAALADFLACGERMVQWGLDSPALAPWRVGAAEAWLRSGSRERASALIEEQLAQLASFRLPRSLGITLRLLAAVREPAERPAILERALGALQHSGDRYEISRVLADLSEAHRASGNWNKSRKAARRARRLSRDIQASATAAPSRTEPAADPGGGNGGVDTFAKLSSSERRVALLAAAGYSNREIAARIYVTVSTVEQHLTRVYRKLRITRREELPIDFGADAAGGHA